MNRLILLAYNLLLPPLFLLLLPGYLLRIFRRGGYSHKACQRFGILDGETLKRIGKGRLWIHAVSVGEVGIALKFVSRYRLLHPDARFLITSTTSTGLAILERSASPWLEPMANPVDFPMITRRLVKRILPSALLFVEADLWPNRIAAAKRLGIPVALLNARLSSRSEARFAAVRPIASAWFNQLDLITLSDEIDRNRFLSLGVRPGILRLTGNIKHDGGGKPATPGSPAGHVLLAASTHRGEEEVMAAAWLELRSSFPELCLVIAPRHAERRHEIRNTLEKEGIPCALRSEKADLSRTPLLLDSTGELSSWYPRATVVFVGKSLSRSVNKGGQNMIEPLQAGAPVLIGPHTGNFEPLATHLCDAGAAIRVDDQGEIVAATGSLLGDDSKRTAMITSAANVLQTHQGATTRNCEQVQSLLLGI